MKLIRPVPPLEPRKILIVQLRRIGDALLCTPAIRALSEKFPGAWIDFLAEYPAEETVRNHPRLRRVWAIPFKGLPKVISTARHLRREKYDLVIDFFSNPRSAQLVFATGGKVRVGLGRRGRSWAYTHSIVEEPQDENLYAVDMRLKMLEMLGVPCSSRKLEIFSDLNDSTAKQRAAELVDSLTGVVVAVAAGSSNPAKRYPADLTAQVIELLRASHLQVVLTSGPGEQEYAQRILDKLQVKVPHLDNAHVADLAALYRHCALYVGPDSGTKHVAAACGIPTVTIFGPGNPANWNDPQDERNIVIAPTCKFRPKCDELTCVRLGHLSTITPREVLGASLKLLLQ